MIISPGETGPLQKLAAFTILALMSAGVAEITVRLTGILMKLAAPVRSTSTKPRYVPGVRFGLAEIEIVAGVLDRPGITPKPTGPGLLSGATRN